jgi:glycosyltransferase involved in cell wall biosynthesis
MTALFSHTVIVVSKHDLDRHMMPLVGKKLVHIPTSVPHMLFKDREEARNALFSETQRIGHADDLWVVSTGEFTQNKNLLRLLEAVHHANSTQTRKIFLSFLGEGEERGVLESYVKTQHMEEQVVFLGFVENARTYLKAFDVFVLPSLKEGMPYGLLEAGLAGLYVIASNVGGIPDVIRHGETGILIDPTLTTVLAKALCEVATTHGHMGEALHTRVQNEFTIEGMLDKTMRLYA